MSEKLVSSKDAQKIMEEIKEKAKDEDTHLECLDLIKRHLDTLPIEAYFIAKELSKSDDISIKEKAKQILSEYHEKYPELDRLEKSLANTMAAISSISKTISLYRELQIPVLKTLKIAQQFAEVHQNLSKVLPKIEKLQLQYEKLPIYYTSYRTDRLANIEAKLDEIYQEIQELKKARSIDKEEYERLKKRLKELEEDVDKAYQ
jgi:DNA repair exonuclease SbcCD ATPase subunit